MSTLLENKAVCDKCGKIFPATRRRFYCEHCKKYYHVCFECKEKNPHCPHCGVILLYKTEPMKHPSK